ncbi:MAG TPA: hypothetical protein PKE01_05210 [Rhodocyclaceae bacterium]|uniref:hypothetical protein n=1 Tax=Zoogloea sp. TaxID=49181 RepID=UPI002C29632E|nr:hypothetical protein [Zoogloea sp.]HMV62709.1 hypothetical protein [Rhodocyclaceae bacterium]HMY98117.1 hypothetical protein [Burkholderiaceae bacterium]HNH16410.1 hypothetical protein [Zoogloea sp.]
MKLRVTRAFFLAGGSLQEVGAEIDLDDKALAGMLLHTGKVERIADEPEGDKPSAKSMKKKAAE